MILTANILARLCSGTYNYMINTKVVFRKRPTADTAVKYAFLAGAVLVFNNIFLSIYTVCLHMDVFYAKLMTEITLFYIELSGAENVYFHRKSRKN